MERLSEEQHREVIAEIKHSELPKKNAGIFDCVG